jgi:hypothetical protein
MPYIDIDLCDFDDDEIANEYEARGLGLTPGYSNRDSMVQAINEIYHLRRMGRPYEHELNKLICDTLGVVA